MEVYYQWEERAEAKISEFICDCGEKYTDVFVAHHGCGREEIEGINCECGRYWKAKWQGMTLEEQ